MGVSKANSDDDTIAQNFFRQAIDLDPTFAPGYSALALAQLQAAAVYQKLSLAEAQSSAEALARRAVSLEAFYGCFHRARRVARQNSGVRCRPRRRSAVA